MQNLFSNACPLFGPAFFAFQFTGQHEEATAFPFYELYFFHLKGPLRASIFLTLKKIHKTVESKPSYFFHLGAVMFRGKALCIILVPSRICVCLIEKTGLIFLYLVFDQPWNWEINLYAFARFLMQRHYIVKALEDISSHMVQKCTVLHCATHHRLSQ